MTRARLLGAVAVAALAVWVAARTPHAFDVRRHEAQARAVLADPRVVTRTLPEAPVGRREGVNGRLRYRPHGWLSVVTLTGLPALQGKDRYLVFLRNHTGWSLAGAAVPAADGSAQVRFGAEPRASSIFEVIVTVAPDGGDSLPHGTALLHWFDPSATRLHIKPFDLSKVS